jgi:glycerol-3-phosphate dehydrogenase
MKRDPQKLANQKFDVLVVGGGIHGAITAWDAALRGLSVALIERGDFGSGTSQNSLKIVHGGLRHFQAGNLSRIRMMTRECATWMKIAPHLVHPLTCLIPTTQKISRSRAVMGLALMANDILSFDRNQLADPEKNLLDGMIVSRQELSRILPGYDASTSTGGAVWYDAQIYNSERLLLEFIHSAADAGAEVANYVEATSFIQQDTRVIGIRAKDFQTGELFDIQSSLVINCAGAWMDCLLEKAALPSEFATSVAMNVIVNQVWSDIAVGLTSQTVHGKPPQVLFIVPWRNKSLIGTYNIPWRDAPHTFKLSEGMVQEFLDQINSACPPRTFYLDDVEHVTWGFLPVHKADLNNQHVKPTGDGVVIDHQKRDGISGLISILGAKYTTARVIAERAMDLAVKQLGIRTKKCQTHMTPVRGGKIEDFRAFLKKALLKVPRVIHERSTEHLVYTYGSEYQRLVDCMLRQPDLARRIDAPLPVTLAEVEHAIHHEMALHLSDVIGRRTELGSTGLPSMATLQKCASLLSREFQWTSQHEEQEIRSVIQTYPFKQVKATTG